MSEVNSENMKWYIVTTYSGNEQKVAENIERRKVSMDLEKYIGRVIVIMEDEPVIDKKTGKQKMQKNPETGVDEPKFKKKNPFPGYVFVEMDMTDESWFMVRNTPRVTGIAGSSGGGTKPTPVPPKEMEAVLKRAGLVDDYMYDRYKVGDIVKVIGGTFESIEGAIQSIDKEKNLVKIDAIFFGRHTTIEVDFSEIVKA